VANGVTPAGMAAVHARFRCKLPKCLFRRQSMPGEGVRLAKCKTLTWKCRPSSEVVAWRRRSPRERSCPNGPFGDHMGFYAVWRLQPLGRFQCGPTQRVTRCSHHLQRPGRRKRRRCWRSP